MAGEMAVAPRATVRLDLSPSPDQLLAAMRRNIRRQVRKAAGAGVVVRLGEAPDLPLLGPLIEETARRSGFTTFPTVYYEQMWRSFAPAGQAALLIAELEGAPLGALLVLGWGTTAVSKVSGNNGHAREVFSDSTLYWEAIQWAREQGHRRFDMEGIDLDAARAYQAGEELPAAHRCSGFTHVKLGFGGEVVVLPRAHDRVHPRVAGPLAMGALRRLEDGRARALANRLLGRRP